MEFAASIIAIVELSVSISFTCLEYARAVRVAGEEASVLHKELGSLVQIVSQLQRPAISDALKITLGPDLKSCQKDLKKLQTKLKPIVSNASFRQTLLWPFRQRGEFQRIAARIQKYFELFDKAVAVSTLEMTDAIAKQLSDLRQSREADRSLFIDRFDELGRGITQFRDAAEKENYEKIMRWLKVVDYEQSFAANVAVLNPNTCGWFFEDGKYFNKWIRCASDSHRNILVQGRAGAGKTILMSSTVKTALSFQFPSTSKVCVAYYYYDFRDVKKTTNSMLCSLIHQLISRTSLIPEKLRELQSSQASATSVPCAALEDVLAQQCSDFDTMFFIIDALDESEKIQDFGNLVAKLTKNVRSNTDLRFLCFSREENSVQRCLAPLTFSVKSLESSVVGQDIATYIKDALGDTQKFTVFHRSSDKTREQVIRTLEEKSDGIFRWVECQLDAISRCLSPREMKEVLSTLPPTLDTTYKRIFREISRSPYNLRRAQCILTWLIGSNNPMTVGMLMEALTIDYDRFEIDEEDRVDSEAISDICRSLIRESAHKDQEEWPNCKIVALAHFTVEQYVLSPEAGEYRLHWEDIHIRLAKSCLTLSSSPVWERLKDSYSQEGFDPKSCGDIAQLLDYACGNLFSHLQYPGVEGHVFGDIVTVLGQDQKLQCLQSNCSIIHLWSSEFDTPFPTGLLISIRIQHPIASDSELLSIVKDINHTSSILVKAIVAGLPLTAYWLVQNSIDMNTVDTYYRTPLALLVALRASNQIETFLIKNRERHNRVTTADPECAELALQSIIGTTVNGLLTAISIGSTDIFHMLLHETVVCLDLMQNQSRRRTLYWKMIRLCIVLSAAYGMCELLVHLQQHASVNNSLEPQELLQLAHEALYVAVCKDKANCVQVLLDSGVSPVSRVILQKTSITSRYSWDITLDNTNKNWASLLNPDLLLDQMDEYIKNAYFSEGGPQCALKAGIHNINLAYKFIEKNPSYYLMDDDIFAAAVEGWVLRRKDEHLTEDLIKDLDGLHMLLFDFLEQPKHKAKLDLALLICSRDRLERSAIVKELLAKGANPNCSIARDKNNEGPTPLIAACKKGHLDVVKLLLEAGADPDLGDGHGQLPSIAAFSSFRRLSDCEQIFGVLQRAKPTLKLRTTQALVDPPPRFDKYGWSCRPGSAISAFVLSFRDRSEDIPMDFLRSTGLLDDLDFHLVGDDCGTPLIAASVTNQSSLVDLLLDHGATTTAQGHADTEWSLPVLAAIYGQHGEMALKLMEKDVEKSIEAFASSDKWSKALMFVLGYDEYFPKQCEVAVKLIERGVNLNFVMDEQDSDFPLFSEDRDQTRQSLLDWGTPMFAACAGGVAGLIEDLRARNADEQPSCTASCGDCLTAAASSGQVGAIEVFLDRGDNVRKCSQGRTKWCPLVAAAQIGYSMTAPEVVKILLKAGARANQLYPFQNPAPKSDTLEVMILDLKKSLHFSLLWTRMWNDCKITGSSLLHAKPFYGTPFIAATCGRDEDIMKLIAEQEGVDVNQEVSVGLYPTAMMACLEMKKMYRTVGELRELGALPITAEQMLQFAFPFRAISRDIVADNALLSVQNSFWGNMITLCVNVEIIIPYLLQRGADPNEIVPGSFYGSAFIAAAALLRLDAVLCFLEHGCAINNVVQGSPFGTPLIAVCSGPPHYPFQFCFNEQYDLNDPVNWSIVQHDLLRILLDGGADPNITYRYFSPLIALVLCDTHEDYKMDSLKMLLDRGADPTIVLSQWGHDEVNPKKQWSAISIADRKGEIEVKKLLEQYAGGNPRSSRSHDEATIKEKIRWRETEPRRAR